jgi:hypothetical protein
MMGGFENMFYSHNINKEKALSSNQYNIHSKINLADSSRAIGVPAKGPAIQSPEIFFPINYISIRVSIMLN